MKKFSLFAVAAVIGGLAAYLSISRSVFYPLALVVAHVLAIVFRPWENKP